MEERELLYKCISGDNAAWKFFIEKYSPLIKSVIATSLASKKNTSEFNDAFQEVLEELSKNEFAVLRSFEGKSRFTTWLWTVARRKVQRYLEGLEDFEFLETETARNLQSPDKPVKDAEEHELNGIVKECLAGLDAKEGLVIRLYYISGLSYKEVAKESGIPEKYISTAIFRARQRLSKIIKKRYDK